MELGDDRVWDYAGDNYVHRLVQNKADGKLIEAGSDPVPENMGKWCMEDDKIDSIQLEYTYLLTNQLEGQRRFYEDRITHLENSTRREVISTKK